MFCTFTFFCFCYLNDGVKIVSVMEGDSVTLHTVSDIHRDEMPYMLLWIGPKNTGIVQVIWFDEKTPDIRYYHDETFSDRLQMDNQTGFLTIRDIRTTDSGLYQMHSPVSRESFNVTVYTHLPIPVITRISSNYSSSSGSPSQDSVQCCGFTEAVIRLVISAVVGVATVAIVVYDITSRRAEQKWRTSQSVHE